MDKAINEIKQCIEYLQFQQRMKEQERDTFPYWSLQHQKAQGEVLGMAGAIGYLKGQVRAWEIEQRVKTQSERESA